MRASAWLLLFLVAVFAVFRTFNSSAQTEIRALEASLEHCIKNGNGYQKEMALLQKSLLKCSAESESVSSDVSEQRGGDTSPEMLNEVPLALVASERKLLRALYGDVDEVAVQMSFANDLELTLLVDVASMPHTSRYFLDLVERRWWDGCHAIRNAPHVVQFDCNEVHPDHPPVAYQEYNAQKPHTQYTLGLAGRPGGPDFYISVIDNSAGHGPGGQSGGKDSVADPCFARIADDSVKWVSVLQTRMGNKGDSKLHFLAREDYLKIERMRVVKK